MNLTKKPDNAGIYEKDLDSYYKAMCAGDHHICVAIEQRHGLYGLSPEIVTKALSDAKKK